MSIIKNGASVGGLALIVAMALPQEVVGQRSGVEVWSANCGRCHSVQPPNRYMAKDWESIVTHMIITARLTDAEGEAVEAFLLSGAKRTGNETQAASAEPRETESLGSAASLRTDSDSGALLYKQQCVACHGVKGKGDGPAAVAFNPRPADLNNPDFWAGRTDKQVLDVLLNGKGSMPAFATVLKPDEIQSLVTYLRDWFTQNGGAYVVRTQPEH
jgi:mono/diheme cytochrome c family protein